MGCGGSGSGTNQAPVQESNQGDPSQPAPVQQITGGVMTYHNNNARTGVYTAETTLTPANVNVLSFGRVAAIAVQGDIYAQPLYLPNVQMTDGKNHNVVVIATEHDQLYAIDADAKNLLWKKSFLDSEGNVTPVPASDVNCQAITPELGITGTPVFDPATLAVYMVVRTKEISDGQASYYQRLHAIGITTGQDIAPASVIASPGGGEFGAAHFDPLLNLQRSALLLANGQVYVTWASHCDHGSYQGWLMAFDQRSLQPSAAWTSDPDGSYGGIWMAGGGPSADANGNIYLATGNGWSDAMSGGNNYGDSVVKLRQAAGAFTVVDYFMPFDWEMMFDGDADLGSGGPVLLPAQPGAPHQHLLTVLSKGGTLYLIDADNMGKWRANNNNQIVQSFAIDSPGVLGQEAFWNNTLYFGFGTAESLAYDPNAQQINPVPVSMSTGISLGYPGAPTSISANGATNAVLWLAQASGAHDGTPAILRAFDPTDLTTELYDSEMSPNRDGAGPALKFVVPTVADGQVFVGTRSELDIYGLLSK
ncbi:MAG: PQQ-binding-like beta-propeller repeat protein [Candidatus Korobacteraceae bacterium]